MILVHRIAHLLETVKPPSNGIVALVSVLVITVISGYISTFLLIGSKREQRGLNEPAVRPIQLAQEVVVPQTVYTPDDGVPGIGDPTRARTTTVVPRVESPVPRHPAYEQFEGPPLLEPVE